MCTKTKERGKKEPSCVRREKETIILPWNINVAHKRELKMGNRPSLIKRRKYV